MDLGHAAGYISPMTTNQNVLLLASTAYPIIVSWLNQYGNVITYGDLCRMLPRPFGGVIDPNSELLSDALLHIIRRCRVAKLPLLSAMVVNGITKRPGQGYYQPAHGMDEADPGAIPAWQAELASVLAATYPPQLP